MVACARGRHETGKNGCETVAVSVEGVEGGDFEGRIVRRKHSQVEWREKVGEGDGIVANSKDLRCEPYFT